MIAVPENEEQAKAYFWARKPPVYHPPPNEWVKQMLAPLFEEKMQMESNMSMDKINCCKG